MKNAFYLQKKTSSRTWEGERENQKKNKNRKTAFPQIHEKKIQNGRGKKTQKYKTDKNAFLH